MTFFDNEDGDCSYIALHVLNKLKFWIITANLILKNSGLGMRTPDALNDSAT